MSGDLSSLTMKQKIRFARRWIRLHPEESMTILAESGRIKVCDCCLGVTPDKDAVEEDSVH